jgi:LysR family glycine cleavage system transcriptional activator
MATLNQLHLNGLRAVEAVLRGGSLQSAAGELGVSASAISQHVARAEAQLKRTIFERTPTGLVPTPFGIEFGRRLTAGFDELARAAALADESSQKTLVVAAAPVFASRWLMPRLMRHFARYPDVLLRIDASPKLSDLDHSDVSLAIRLGEGNWPGVRSELLFEVKEFPVCVPEMAKDLKTVEDLRNAWVILDDNTMLGWNTWFRAAGVEPFEMLPGARFSDPMLCLESVLAGHGLMLAWDLLAGEALRDGRLVAPFGITATSGLGYHVITSARRQPEQKVKNFIRWLKDEVAAAGPSGAG